MTAHWGIPDPAAAVGTPEKIERVFSQAFASFNRRISLFLNLPIGTLDKFVLKSELDKIGRK
jgi:arsenate reductase